MVDRNALEAVVVEAIEASARVIGGFGPEPPKPFREREMQDVLVAQLEQALAVADLPLSARESLPITLESWPKVGPVDVALLEDDDTRWAFLELKWGDGTLYNCVWDLAKMATAVNSEGGTQAGYLVAGAPTVDWSGADGAELFSSGTTRLVDLYKRYPASWRKWCMDVKTHPRLLPQLASRTHVSTVLLEFRDQPWEIRCVRVSSAAARTRWWRVATVEQSLGICDRKDDLLEVVPESVSVADSPYPSDSEVQTAEDHRRFDEGDSEALWRLVRNPPRWWRFVWFPGDVDIVGQSAEETWGAEAAALLRLTRSIETLADLHEAEAAVDAFIKAHPGDPTAISGGRNCVYAERGLKAEPGVNSESDPLR